MSGTLSVGEKRPEQTLYILQLQQQELASGDGRQGCGAERKAKIYEQDDDDAADDCAAGDDVAALKP